MKTLVPTKCPVRWLVLAAGAVLVLLAGALAVAGVNAIELNHSVARIRFDGLESEADYGRVMGALRDLPGYRRSELARRNLASREPGRAVLEFEAGSITEAAVRLVEWQQQFAAPLRVTVEELRFDAARLRRTGRGDILLGLRQTLSGDEFGAVTHGTIRPE